MNRGVALQALGVAFVFSITCSAAHPAGPLSPAQIDAVAANAAHEPLDVLVKDVEHRHPAAMFILAKRQFDAGRRDEAVFWFYEGQLRWHALIASLSGQPIVNGEQDHFKVLSSEVGPDINHYAFGDIPALLRTMDRVLDWDTAHPDDFAPKGKTKDDARAGLKQFEAYLLANEDALAKKSAEEMRFANAGAVAGDPYSGTGGTFAGTPAAMLAVYDSRTFASFRLGVTTKGDVVKALGRPEVWTTEPNGITHIAYSYRKATPAALADIMQRVLVSFTFDSKRILTAINLPKGQ